MDLTSGYYQVPLDESSKDITSFIVPQGRFRFNVLLMGLKPSSDFFNPATQMLEENEQKDNIKLVDDVASGSETVDRIKSKVKSVLEFCRRIYFRKNLYRFCTPPLVTQFPSSLHRKVPQRGPLGRTAVVSERRYKRLFSNPFLSQI